MLSARDEEILRLYDDENLTQKQIAYRLGISQQTVSNIIKKQTKISAEKGIGKKTDVVSKHLKSFRLSAKAQLWRFHALEFTISPYYLYPRYETIRKERGNWFIHEDWNVKLNEKTITLKLRRGYDFIHEDKYESVRLAEESLNRTLYFLSNSCGFQFEKEGRISIRLNKQHLAKTNSPLAKANKGEYLQVKGIDGKVWLLFDKSKGLVEHEFIHAGRLMADSDTIDSFLNDLREHPDLSLSELNEDQRLTRQAITEFTTQLKLHLEVMAEIRDSFKEFRKSLKH